MWGEHDPGSLRAQSKGAEEPANPGREMNLQLLASAQRFLQGSLLAASVPRLKDAPAIRIRTRSKDLPTVTAWPLLRSGLARCVPDSRVNQGEQRSLPDRPIRSPTWDQAGSAADHDGLLSRCAKPPPIPASGPPR